MTANPARRLRPGQKDKRLDEYVASLPVDWEYAHWLPDLPGPKTLREDRRQLKRSRTQWEKELAALEREREHWTEDDKYEYELLREELQAVDPQLKVIEELLPLVSNPSPDVKGLKARLLR